MRLFVLPAGERAAGPGGLPRLAIRGKDFHYLSRVLRLKPGDSFAGLDGDAGRRSCRILEVGRDSLVVELEGDVQPCHRPGPCLTLVQALPKGQKMDQIVRQATEAGIHRLVPVISRYSESHLRDPGQARQKQLRWQRIAREALQQSGGLRLPAVEPPCSLQEAIETLDPGGLGLFLHPAPDGPVPPGQSLHARLAADPAGISVVVGPEGGLSGEELDLLKGRGFLPVSLGRNILRTETAAIYALAAIYMILQEREAWQPA